MNSFISLLLLASLLSISLALYIKRRVKAHGAGYLSLLMLAVGVWSACYAAELHAGELQGMLFWASCAYFGILLVPPAWLSFTLAFTGRKDLITPRYILLISIVPLVMLLLVWSNPLHGLFYSRVELMTTALGTAAVYQHGPIFWVNAVYTYVILLTGSFILVRSMLSSRNPIRGQVIALLAAVLMPWLGNAVYLSGANPVPQLDLTPLSFVFSGIAVFWALYNYGLLDIVPVAHAALIANLQDGLIVLDSRGRIAELNAAAEAIFCQPAPSLIGRVVAELDWGTHGPPLDVLESPQGEIEIAIPAGEELRYYDLRSSTLRDHRGGDNGRLVILRDITERIMSDESLDRSEAILEAVNIAAERFLSAATWEEAIPEVLKRFGEAARVSRAYIFENRPGLRDEVLTSQRYEWAAEGIEPQIDNLELQDLSYRTSGIGRWEEILSHGEVFCELTSSLPAGEQPMLIDEQIQSIALAPIFAAQEWWGFIGLDECTYPRRWTRGEVDALQAAAGVIGSSIARQKTEKTLRQRVDELASLHEVSLVINSPHKLPVLLTKIVERAVKLLGGTSGGFYLCDPEKRELECVMSTGTVHDITGIRLKYGEGASGLVAQTGQPLIIDDYRTWEGRAAVYEHEQPFRSVLSAPLIWQEHILGVINILHDRETQRFTAEHLTLLSLFANQAAIALHNAQEYAETQKRAGRIAMLNELTQSSIRASDLEGMLQTLADRLDKLFEADNTYITFWDEEHQTVTPAAAHGALSEAYMALRPYPGETSMTGSVLQAGRVLVADDIFYSPYITPRQAALFPARSIMGLPLIADNRKLGAALIGFEHPHHFTQDEIDLAEEVSSQISLAMTKIRLLELERRRSSELEALRETVAELSTELDLSALLQSILERATELLDASGGDLGLYDAARNEIHIVASHNMGKDYTGVYMASGEGAMGRAVEIGEPVIVEDYRSWEGRSEQYIELPYHAVLAVPLQVHGRVVGALGIVDRNPRRRFTADDQRLLFLFSQQAANAIEKARLYAEQKRRTADLEVLFESSKALAETLDLAEVYSIATERLAQAVGATSARVLSLDLEKGQATVKAEFSSPQAGSREHIYDVGATYNLDDYPQTLAALRAGKPLALCISNPNLNASDRIEMNQYGIQSALNLPMMASDQTIGYAEIWDSRNERVWTEEEIQFCQTLANQAALVIENARLYHQMQRLAITDTLTGVYNRRGLFEHGQREINRAIRTARPLAAIMLDIDHFKQVNDTHSHAAGDQVLQALAKLCQENLREVDIFGRYGGEEFAVLLPDTDIDSAIQAAERLRRCVSEAEISTQDGVLFISISLGVASTEGETSSLAVLLDRADTAMYAAKHSGRNRVYLAQPSQIPADCPAEVTTLSG